ncbi:MAG: hypothetical protein AAF429_09060 [Pseudomonadota bacterium]
MPIRRKSLAERLETAKPVPASMEQPKPEIPTAIDRPVEAEVPKSDTKPQKKPEPKPAPKSRKAQPDAERAGQGTVSVEAKFFITGAMQEMIDQLAERSKMPSIEVERILSSKLHREFRTRSASGKLGELKELPNKDKDTDREIRIRNAAVTETEREAAINAVDPFRAFKNQRLITTVYKRLLFTLLKEHIEEK